MEPFRRTDAHALSAATTNRTTKINISLATTTTTTTIITITTATTAITTTLNYHSCHQADCR
jgi:hypothetical protein